ncbi:MAG: hypothetical protein KJO07_00750, partial [Deltaproteobacteria bacterium]|nr:hypothetical protein [Deltaproteobacteria bacterium]
SEGPLDCFDGDPALAGVGACTRGTRSCLEGTNTWSACEGSAAPRFEVCNDGRDDDCDGTADEGVLNACGNCLAGCGTTGVGDDPFPTEDDDPNVDQTGTGLDPNGDIILDSAQVETYFLWIANSGEGTVSKIDTRTGQEVARYPSVVKSNGRLIVGDCNGAGGDKGCDASKVPNWDASGGLGNNNPSRTAIDAFGDCWVGNRAHSGGVTGEQSTATKFFNNTGVDPENIAADIPAAASDCRDFDGDGTITTSRDINGDGKIDIGATGANQEFFPDDECVAATVMLGEQLTASSTAAGARALAIDAGGFNVDFGGPDPNNPGNAWVGMFQESAFYRVTLGFTGNTPVASTARVPETGTITSVTGATDFKPYGAAIDSKGVVWAPSRGADDELVAFRSDSADFGDLALTFVPEDTNDYVYGVPSGNNYGIVIDLEDRIWLGGWTSQHVTRYDPEAALGSRWTQWPVNDGRVRGMAIDVNGYVWAAISATGDNSTQISKAIRIPADTADTVNYLVYDLETAAGGAAGGSIGIGVDFDGQVWTVNQDNSNVTKLSIDTANDLDGDGLVGDPLGVTVGNKTGNITATKYLYDSENGNNAAPYTYSDFTGLSLRAVTRPSGLYSIAMQGCPGEAEADWRGVSFDAVIPNTATAVQVFVQVGNDLATLKDQPSYGPWTVSPIDLDSPAPSPPAPMGQGVVPDGAYLRLTFVLISEDRISTPIVRGYNVDWTCPSSGIE